MKTLLTPEMAVMTKAKELGNYVITVTNSSPKKYRFTFVSRMQNLALDLVEAIFRANGVYIGKGAHVENAELRRRLQSDARSSAALLSYMAMVAQENQCILTKQYAIIADKVEECQRLLTAWVASDNRRLSSTMVGATA